MFKSVKLYIYCFIAHRYVRLGRFYSIMSLKLSKIACKKMRKSNEYLVKIENIESSLNGLES